MYGDKIEFVNENTGWYLGREINGIGQIYKTTNAGINWQYQFGMSSENRFLKSSFINALTGFVIFNAQYIMKTTNGGNNWFTYMDYSPPTEYVDISFVNENTGWLIVGGGNYLVKKTTNGGNNWFNQTTPQNAGGSKIKFLNPNTGYLVEAWGDELIKTTNGGNNWFILQTATTNAINSCYFVNENTGWFVGDGKTILRTNSGGEQVSINPISNLIPDNFYLKQNYPNPFNPSTKIEFSIPVSSYIKLTIYDISGRKISYMFNRYLSAGEF